MNPDHAAPYEALAEVIERELALVPTRDFTALSAIKRERGVIVKRLPATPPPEARVALERCQRAQAEIGIELHRMRETLLHELRQVGRAQRAAHGYAPVPGPRRLRISASA